MVVGPFTPPQRKRGGEKKNPFPGCALYGAGWKKREKGKKIKKKKRESEKAKRTRLKLSLSPDTARFTG